MVFAKYIKLKNSCRPSCELMISAVTQYFNAPCYTYNDDYNVTHPGTVHKLQYTYTLSLIIHVKLVVKQKEI